MGATHLEIEAPTRKIVDMTPMTGENGSTLRQNFGTNLIENLYLN